MPSTTTGTSERSNSIQTLLSMELQFEAARTQVWGQFPMVPADGAISQPRGGQSVTLRYQQRLGLATDTINEKADVTPQRVTDNIVAVTINEYGAAVQDTRLAELVVRGDLRTAMARVIAEQQVASLDRIAGRQYYEGQNLVFRPNSNATRVLLDATNDVLPDSSVGMSFLARGTSTLRAARAPGFVSDSNGLAKYATVVHSALGQDLPETAGYLSALQYKDGVDTLFNGELAEIRGLRFTESAQGKVYPGAGTAAQAATTLSASAAAGATTVVVANATGLAVGDVITIGTLEDGATVTSETDALVNGIIESVQITAVNGTTLTVAGLGFSSGDISVPGVRYAHASGESVIEAALVAAIPIFGPESVIKAYAAEVGEFGEAKVTGPFDVLGRFVNLGWYAVCGFGKTNGLWTVRLEVATKFPQIVINE